MKNLLLWAVLCTAYSSFAMDQIPFEHLPASPGKALSEEDLKSLLSVTQANSPEEPRSASSSPIPLDPSQEQFADYSNATEELRSIFLHSKEKIWHHTFSEELKRDRDCGPLDSDQSESAYPAQPYFFQQKSALNIVLRDLIRHQKFDEIIDLVYELTKYDDCNLADIISDKTIDVAFETMNKRQTNISETIYSIISEQTEDISASEADTTAESLKRVFTNELDKIKLSKKSERAMARSKILTCIENSNSDVINQLLSKYESDAQAAKDVSHDILKTAQIMRDRVFDLQQLMYDPLTGERIAHNAYEVCQRLHQVVHNPCPVSYILSDEEENGPVYSEGELDRQRVLERVRNAFSFPTLESIVGSEKVGTIIQLLEQEKKSKKQGELDWVSPQSSPSEGLREYLGSFKSESLSD